MINLVPIKTRHYHSQLWTLQILIWIWCKPTDDNVFYHFIRSPNDLQHVISTETVTSAGSSNCLIWLLYHLNHSTKLFHPIIWYPYLSIFQILSSCGLMGRNMYDHLGFVALGYHCYQFWALHWTCSCLLRYLSSSSCLPILSSSYHLYMSNSMRDLEVEGHPVLVLQLVALNQIPTIGSLDVPQADGSYISQLFLVVNIPQECTRIWG